MHRKLITLLLVLFIATIAAAQSTAPNPVTGEVAPVTLGDSGVKTNVIQGGFTAQGVYDNSSYVPNADAGWVTYLQSNFSLIQQRSHARWRLEYDPGALLDEKGQVGSLVNQSVGADVIYQIARHTTLRAHNNFRIDSSILRPGPLEVVPEFGIFNRPNDTLLSPYSRRTYEQAGLDVTQMLSARSQFSLSGNFNLVNFRELSTIAGQPQQLVDTRAADGEASYSYRLSRRHSIGVTYQYQDYWVEGVDSGGQTHGVFYTHNITFNDRMSLSAYVGPQFSRNHNQLFIEIFNGSELDRHFEQSNFSGWSVSTGATFRVQGKNTGLAFSAVRRVNDGNGLSGAGRYNDAQVSLRRQFLRRWSAGANFDYSNTSLFGTVSPVSYNAISAGASVERQLRNGFAVTASYSRIHQNNTGSQAIRSNLDHDQVAMGLSYQFSRGLGH